MNQIGFIGAGHIATAIMNGMYRGGIDIHRIERFCVDSAEFFLFSIVSATI